MPDTTTVYLSKTLGPVRVFDMHPTHAQNALAQILSDPTEAARVLSNRPYPSLLNRNAHAAASGFRYYVDAAFPAPTRDNPQATLLVPIFAFRREVARRQRRAYAVAGIASTLYRIGATGVAEKVR